MNDKIRKCTKCIKKFPREELIKRSGNYGGLFCESCCLVIVKKNNTWTWADSGILSIILLAIFFISWLAIKIIDWKYKKNHD